MVKKSQDFPGNSRGLPGKSTWFFIPGTKHSLDPMAAETQQLLNFSAQHLELVLTLFIFIIKQGFPSGNPKVGSEMPEQFWSISEVNLQDSFVLFGPSKVSWMKYVLLVQLMFRCWAAGVYARCVKEERKNPLWSFSYANYTSQHQAADSVLGDCTSSEVGIRWNKESLNCSGVWFSFAVFF